MPAPKLLNLESRSVRKNTNILSLGYGENTAL